MAAKGRISVDITGIEEHLETLRNDPAWRQLSTSGKIRVLIIERIEEKASPGSRIGEEVRL
jgi:hypothetical protein